MTVFSSILDPEIVRVNQAIGSFIYPALSGLSCACAIVDMLEPVLRCSCSYDMNSFVLVCFSMLCCG